MNNTELLQECKLQLEYLNLKFPATGTTNSLLAKIETTLQNQMDNITEPEIRNLEDILLCFGEAHNMLAKTSLSKEEYQPISGLLAKAKVELFNFCNDHKAALQNKVSDISAEGILDKYYKPKMHWKVVNRKNVLAAMHEYASIVNGSKDNVGVWVKASARLPEKLAYYNCKFRGIPIVFYIDSRNETISYDSQIIDKKYWKFTQWLDESQPKQKEVDEYEDEMPPL